MSFWVQRLFETVFQFLSSRISERERARERKDMTGKSGPPAPTSITVDSRYLEIEGTLKNTSRYPYFDISDLLY